jgi:hypothetical protein
MQSSLSLWARGALREALDGAHVTDPGPTAHGSEPTPAADRDRARTGPLCTDGSTQKRMPFVDPGRPSTPMPPFGDGDKQHEPWRAIIRSWK